MISMLAFIRKLIDLKTKILEDQRILAVIVTLVVGVGVCALKFWAAGVTGSTAALSDALESIVNVIAATMACFVIYFIRRPPDLGHPYGHGKMEFFSAIVEAALVLGASVLILFKGAQSLLGNPSLQDLEEGGVAILLATISNGLLALWLHHVAGKTRSATLAASSLHIASDVITSIAVILGFVLVLLTGSFWIDGFLAVLVGIYLAVSSVKSLRESCGALIDEKDTRVISSLCDSLNQSRELGIIDVHGVRVIRSGRFNHVDGDVVLPFFWTVDQSYELLRRYERNVLHHSRLIGEIVFQMEPCRKSFCGQCAIENCSHREKSFCGARDFLDHSVVFSELE